MSGDGNPLELDREQQFLRVLECLNDAVGRDAKAMRALVEHRIVCDEALADHPTIQVRGRGTNQWFDVGALGLVNGVLAAAGLPAIAAKFSDDKQAGTVQLLGFVRYEGAVNELAERS